MIYELMPYFLVYCITSYIFFMCLLLLYLNEEDTFSMNDGSYLGAHVMAFILSPIIAPFYIYYSYKTLLIKLMDTGCGWN